MENTGPDTLPLPLNDAEYWQAQADNRVWDGLRFLNKAAPWGWKWNCFSLNPEGKLSFHALSQHNEECVLAYALMSSARLADGLGYVTRPSATSRLNFSSNDLARLGFDDDFHDGVGVTHAMLNRAWEETLRDRLINQCWRYRHPTAIDRKFAVDDRPRTPTWLERMANI